jgi:hypothetical protein
MAETVGASAPDLFAVLCFALMAACLVRVALKKVAFAAGERP